MRNKQLQYVFMSKNITLGKYKQMRRQQSRASYNQFHQNLRSKYKKQKQERKRSLRQIACPKMIQSSEGQNDEEYLKKRGNNWWSKINRRFFQNLSQDEVQNIRQFSLSQDIMQFGASISPLLNYYQEIICKTQPIIFQDDSIRILYRIQNKIDEQQKHILAGYFLKAGGPSDEQRNQQLLLKLPNFYSFHTIQTKQQQHKIELQEHIEDQIRQIDIFLGGKCQNQQFIKKCLQYETNFRKDLTQIQNQIECWNYQLNQQHKINQEAWDKIQMGIQQQKQKYPDVVDTKNQIQQIKKFLIRCETISYFRSGYADKTIQQYQKALQYIKQNQIQALKQGKKATGNNGSFFETDCKVCFCTKNQPSNKVIYCDSCNTSFHQSCYGVSQIFQDKDFICDACIYLKEMQSNNKSMFRYQSPSCQICGKNKFPIKNIDNHFYHVCCLILFGFAQIRQFKIYLKQGVNHESIMKAVVQNQIQHDYCEYCVKNTFTGMQFKCTDMLCAKSYHPICAYLNGCIFKIIRKDTGIQVKVQCRDHTFPNFNDQASQVYLRRFLCDHRSTSRRRQQQFKQQYLKQIQKVTKSSKIQLLNQSGIQKILKVKRFHHYNAQKQKNSNKPFILIKKQSMASNNSNSKSNEPKLKKTQSDKQKQPNHSRF